MHHGIEQASDAPRSTIRCPFRLGSKRCTYVGVRRAQVMQRNVGRGKPVVVGLDIVVGGMPNPPSSSSRSSAAAITPRFAAGTICQAVVRAREIKGIEWKALELRILL